MKASFAGKVDEYLQILKDERRDLETEIERIEPLAERLKESAQVSCVMRFLGGQTRTG